MRKKRLCLVAMVAVLTAASFGAKRTEALRAKFLSDDREYVFVASHRADRKLAPENSLASLENAIRYGIQVEIQGTGRTAK